MARDALRSSKMTTNLAKIVPPETEQTQKFLWYDQSARLRCEQAERDLAYLRWILIAAAVLYLLFAPNFQDPLLAGGTILIGVLLNALFSYLLYQHSFKFYWSIAAQIADILLLQTYTASLRGGMLAYLPMYTTMIVIATIRFGVVGAAGSGSIGILLYIVLRSMPVSSAPSVTVALVSILANVVLLAHFAYLVWRQQLTYQKSERELHDKVREITALYEISNIVHDLKSEDALQNIVEITTKMMGFQRAALFLTDSVGDMLPHEYHSRSLEAQKNNLGDVFLDKELFQSVLEKDMPIVIDGSQGQPDMAHMLVLQVAVPLHGPETSVGVLIADRNDRGSVSPADKEMLTYLARSAVMAIENASLHRRVKQMANHDGLTEAFNHRYFQEMLRAQVRESQEQWPISLLMIEIDKFKKYNDTFGHRQGDAALVSLARALEMASKPWDGLVARYGGDEFVVILPHVDRTRNLQVARTVRERSCALTGSMLSEQKLPNISLSVGVATYPGDASTAANLIDAADQAMYEVKHSGGNQARAYSKTHPQVV